MASVTEAEGLAELGLWQDAWDVFEVCPPGDRASPDGWRLQLRLCCVLAKWDIGDTLAAGLANGTDEDRLLAARYFQSLALHRLAKGDRDAAGQAIKAAVKAWPDCRMEILEHPQLSEAL